PSHRLFKETPPMIKNSKLTFRRRRGLSMTELMFAAAMFGVAGLFVAALLLEVARHSQTSISMIPSELNSYRVLDRIRTELLAASAQEIEIEGTPVVVDGRQISLEGRAVTF